MDAIGLISVLIGFAGFGYALYQGSERKKLIKLARSQSWFLYSKANNMTGIVQTAQRKYIEKHSTSLDNEVSSLLAKSTAFGQEMFRETIRLIQVSEPDFNFDTIALWQRQGKVDAEHKQLFVELVVDDKDDKIKVTDSTSKTQG